MEKCEVCGFEGEFVNEQYRDSILIFCPDCSHLRVEHCQHENFGLIKYPVGNGFRVQRVCKDCLTLFGNAIKHDGVNINEIRTIDKVKYDNWRSGEDEKYNKRWDKINEMHRLWQVAEHQRKHQEYLNTQTWKEKRKEILERDGYLCQACLKNRASEVHHLTYDHFGDEPFFDLISVCRECHEKISMMDIKRKNLSA